MRYKLDIHGIVVAVDEEHIFIESPKGTVTKYNQSNLPIPRGGYDSLLNKKVYIQVTLWVD